jgi:hypothetical protein
MEYSYRTSERHQNRNFESNIQSSRLNFVPSAYKSCALPMLQADDDSERVNESLTMPESNETKEPFEQRHQYGRRKVAKITTAATKC